MRPLIVRLAVACAPLLLGFALIGAIAEGHLNLGAGDKDIIWALPILAWAGLFFLGDLYFGWRGRSLAAAARRAALVATLALLIPWLLWAVVWLLLRLPYLLR